MKLAITDASIFIDLFSVNLVNQFLGLNIELYTTLEVIDELEEDHQSILKTDEDLIILIEKEANYLDDLDGELSSRLSVADLSIFHHARKLNSGILTGDNLSEGMGFEVHGILWVLNEMVKKSSLSSNDAILKLEQLMDFNRRLPIKECQKITKKWSL